jgi:hypothetical protein
MIYKKVHEPKCRWMSSCCILVGFCWFKFKQLFKVGELKIGREGRKAVMNFLQPIPKINSYSRYEHELPFCNGD